MLFRILGEAPWCSAIDAEALLKIMKVMKEFEFHAEERRSEKPPDAKSLERRKRERTPDVTSGGAEQIHHLVKGNELT